MTTPGGHMIFKEKTAFVSLKGNHWQTLPMMVISAVSRRSAAMPTRNVNLTDELDHFVLQKVESGRYENASEVVRAALRTLEREEQRHEAKLAALRTAIDEGDASGIAEGNVFDRVLEKLTLPLTSR
jgi:antitoxin ParD1/3/4